MFRTLLMLGLLAVSAEALQEKPDKQDSQDKKEDNPRTDPKQAVPGAIGQWESADGLKYEFYVPAGYDPETGANLTLILHGNGLDHRWTFWNHPVGEFRPDDILVSPDGTTFTKGTNANEFLGETKDAARVHKLIEELRAFWKARQVFVYGHSQGSFFAFYYAGQYPDEVDGVCGHSSGVWNWTTMSSKGHHQAIGLIHGTSDGNVPYGQSWWGRKVYRERDYPLVHLRTLFDWGHPPHWHQAQLQLAWCEGMTSDDPARIDACLTSLGNPDVPMGLDWSALWAVADRLAHDKRATDEQRARATAVAAAVDELAAQHVAAIVASLGKEGINQLKTVGEDSLGAAYVGHVLRLIEDFDGVPACEAWRKESRRVLDKVEEQAEADYADYLRESNESRSKAFKAGLDLVDEGWTHYDVPKVAAQLERWAKDPNSDISKNEAKRCATVVDAYRAGRKAGFEEYEQLNAGVKPLDSR